uniref:Uncharacterized protein n=1 Tax=Tetranychus urticae TaxID=32264 RepID=T1L2H5_TETUR
MERLVKVGIFIKQNLGKNQEANLCASLYFLYYHQYKSRETRDSGKWQRINE